LFVRLQADSKSDLIFSVFSLSGMKILSKENFGINGGENTIKINFTSLNPGIYLYSVRNNKLVFTGKLVKTE
jgi:hypothetical protein